MSVMKIGRYRVECLLGQTAFGTAYLAHDDVLRRRALIKLPLRLTGGSTNRNSCGEDLLREGQLLAQLNHPAFVTVFDVGEHEGLPFIAVELVDGAKLGDILAKEQMTLPRVVGLMADVADGIHFIHRRGYFHLHLKPETILVDSTGSPRIDGLSLAMHESESSKRSGQIVGTPYYMAPEQILGDVKNLGTHTDVWALGVIFYEALVGHRPFFGNDIQSLFQDIQNVEPIGPRMLNPAVPERLQQICLRCLRKAPQDRYASVAEFRDALRRWLVAEDLDRTSKRPLIFVSHSTSDQDFVEREIVAPLERNEMETWYSKVSIASSTQWERVILKGLELSDWFILIMSPRSAESEWVKDEVHWAVDKCPKRIIPVLIDACDPRDFHIRLARIQNVDFREDREKARQSLLSTLRQRCLTIS